uniref:DUF659 domain-containing protein n=1 Tax=Amphimedon queenslandica TaxID=400682 RepID=A0A1X7VPL6_AMPQE
MLQGKTVCLSLDGWSNIRNEPIICVVLYTKYGDSFLVQTVDTSGKSHTADCLLTIAKNAIVESQDTFGCQVRSVVTDNAANVAKMRTELQKEDNLNVITYGCSAHLLNLLAKDLSIPGIKDHVVTVVKYFKYVYFANAKYREAGGLKISLALDVCWNSLVHCLQGYISNLPVFIKVCEENREEIDGNASAKVHDLSLKRNIEDLIKRLQSISITFDR